jgi:uncharacterized membrane protein YidH (DUF202 family)
VLAAGIVVGVRLAFPGSEGPAPGPALVAFVADVLGPIVSVVTLIVAYVRTRDVPAIEEEKFEKPFMAWIPVTLLDIALVVIAVLALAIAHPI